MNATYSQTTLNLVTLCFIILLPVVPAMLLFAVLPSTGELSGPFKGMHIKLGGAFAGYFAVVLLVLGSHSLWAPPPAYQVWELSGRVTDEQKQPLQLLE